MRTDRSDRQIVLIPARRASTRLPDKPLAPIAGEPMIVHVWRRAIESGCGRVVVATDDDDVAGAIAERGGEAVLTGAHHASGSDRIFEALERLDPAGAFQVVVNLQGDLPTLDPALVRRLVLTLREGGCDIATLAAETVDEDEARDPNVVKIAAALAGPGSSARAHYFSRQAIPAGAGPLYHHIGIYAYHRAALARFVALPPSPLERRERLEQLRAIEAGMAIRVALVDTLPLGVDTPRDLERARRILGGDRAPAAKAAR